MRSSLRVLGGRGHKMKRSSGPLGEIDYIPKQWFWKPPPQEIKKDEATGWTRASIRTGVIARKVGMSTDWNEWNVRLPLTYLQLENVQVVAHKTEEVHGYNALQLGAVNGKEKHVSKPQLGHFAHAGVPPKRLLREFRITPDAFVPVGSEITVRHFLPGQRVCVRGKSKGKGFQGVMKRHGFGGGNASHGASLSHRQIGSTGSAQDPGHVIKGKKMPGRMGNANRVAVNLLVFKTFPELNVMAVVGHVPGAENGIVTVWDSNKPWKEPIGAPPFPAYIRTEKDVIRSYKDFKEDEYVKEVRGTMPLPWHLRVAQEAGWHVPTPEEIEVQKKRGKIYQIAMGDDNSSDLDAPKGGKAGKGKKASAVDDDEDDDEIPEAKPAKKAAAPKAPKAAKK